MTLPVIEIFAGSVNKQNLVHESLIKRRQSKCSSSWLSVMVDKTTCCAWRASFTSRQYSSECVLPCLRLFVSMSF